jgi:hypothetical protein
VAAFGNVSTNAKSLSVAGTSDQKPRVLDEYLLRLSSHLLILVKIVLVPNICSDLIHASE